jgi:hypothetical protein
LEKQLLIIGFVWPEPRSSAAGSRMLQLIQLFISANYTITFASACAKTDNAFNLNTIGVSTATIALNDSSFDDFLKEINPQVVLFDRFMIEEQFGWRVTEHCSNALKLLDTEDLHCLRKGRQQAYKDNTSFTDDYLFSNIAKREIASILRCDLTLMISEFEMALLQSKFNIKESQLFYIPFLIEDNQILNQNELPAFENRHHFITIGNFFHEPNWQSVLLLKQTIWPKIRQQLPDAQLHIYGAYVSQKATQLHQPKDGFYIDGFAEDVNAVMQNAKICLAYLPFGAGLKGKILDAIQNGTPCAMNSVASEAMFGDFSINGICEDEIGDFVTNTVELYKNESKWINAQTNGFVALKQRFEKELFANNFLERVEAVKQNLNLHRQQHFMGQILQHHTLQSSKYMSKWIEEKNK